MHYKIHPFEQSTPNMFVGFDADGNRVAMELVDSPVSRYEIYVTCICDNKVGGTVPRDEKFEFTCLNCGMCWTGTMSVHTHVKAPVMECK